MKNTLSSFWGRCCTALLLLSIAFIINSCRKETKLTQQQINAGIAEQQFPVNEAMSWFNGNKTTLANKIKLNSATSFLSQLANFTPVWDSARTAADTNYYVVEAPARYLRRIGFASDSNAANVNGFTRLLVLKNKIYNTLGAVLMHIHGDAGVSISNTHYMSVPQTFSGNIFFTNLQGAFINGYIYKNGKVTKKSTGQYASVKPSGPQILVAYDPGDCTTVIVNWLVQSCVYNGSDQLLGCTDWTILYTTMNTYCDDNSGGGSGNNGALAPPQCAPGEGGGSGDSDPDPDPDDPANPPISISSVKGKLVVHYAVPGDGDLPGDPGTPGGTTTTTNSSPCVPVPKDIIDSLKNPCLKAVLAALKNNDFKGKMSDIIHNVFDTNDNVNIYFDDYSNATDQPAKADIPTVTGSTFDITVHMNLAQLGEANQDFDAVIMMHEILHAYMDYNNFYLFNQLKQHQEIAEKYVTSMKDYLQSIYHTPDDAAYSMILNGLSDVFGNNKPAYLDTLKTKYGVSDPLTLYEEYKQGAPWAGGTGCPVPPK